MTAAQTSPTGVLEDAPLHIYLVLETDNSFGDELTFRDYERAVAGGSEGICWCEDRLNSTDVPYVRADVHAALSARVAELEATLLKCARMAEALKQPCSMDPESAQAVRNSQYMDISYVARATLSKGTPA